jgi:hypothetical protein
MMFVKYSGGRYWQFLLVVGSLVILCFVLTLITQILPSSPTPYDPAYYGWSNIVSGRRVLVVLNTDLNPCALERKKTIVIESVETVITTVPISGEPTPSPFEVVLTLDPSGRTTIMERPLAAKYDLIKHDISVNNFWRKTGCEVIQFGSMFMTTPVAPRPPVNSTPVSAQ